MSSDDCTMFVTTTILSIHYFGMFYKLLFRLSKHCKSKVINSLNTLNCYAVLMQTLKHFSIEQLVILMVMLILVGFESYNFSIIFIPCYSSQTYIKPQNL